MRKVYELNHIHMILNKCKSNLLPETTTYCLYKYGILSHWLDVKHSVRIVYGAVLCTEYSVQRTLYRVYTDN